MPAADPDIGTSSTSFDAVEVKPREEVPSPVSLIGNDFLITPPASHDKCGRRMDLGETSYGPSLQYVKKVLKSVLSSWIETLSSGHLEAWFGMIKHV